MIQHRPFLQPNQDLSILTSQLKQYKKINNSLRKKIKEKDNRIQQLFGYIQDAGIPYSINPETMPMRIQYPQQRSQKIGRSQSKRKEKQDKNSDHFEQSNIFKQPSYSIIQRMSRPDVHLPSLEKRNKNIFQQDETVIQNPEKKTKIVKISLEKLKPLNPEQVKKRFLMKYQKVDQNEE